MKRFSHIDCWVFDLDNTIYDADAHVFPEMGRKINEYVARLLDIPMEEAQARRNAFYAKYGTTLQGLIKEHGADPRPFMEYTHALEISAIEKCAVTAAAIEKLPGRKIIHTNAPVYHARRILKHLGIDQLFDGMFGIEEAGYVSKPDISGYHKVIAAFGVDPLRACMFEDMEANLKSAHQLGMTTVWLHRGQDADHGHVHHKSPFLKDFFEGLSQ